MAASRPKYATAFVMDVGPGMAPYFAQAQNALIKFVQRKMFFRKAEEIGIVNFGTNDTINHMNEGDPDFWKHITTQREILPADLTVIERIKEVKCGDEAADVTDALITAFDLLHTKTDKKKYVRNMILLADASGASQGWSDLETVQEGMNSESCSTKLTVVGCGLPDFDGDLAAVTFENAPELANHKKHNFKMLRKLVDGMPGSRVISLEEFVSELDGAQAIPVLQTPKFTGLLEVTPHLKIRVKAFGKTAEARFPSMKKLSTVARDSANPGTMKVRMDRTYFSTFDEGEEVPPDLRLKGYTYGKQRVPLSSVEEKASYSAEKCLQVIGFCASKSVPRHHFMGPTDCICGDPADQEGQLLIASLSKALEQSRRVAIVRWVKRENIPILGMLCSHVEGNARCLLFSQLPFAEDIRHFRFASFDRPSCRPTPAQLAAADAVIDSMMLTDDQFVPEKTYNPVLQHVYRAIQERAVAGKEQPIPDLEPEFAKFFDVPPEIEAAAADHIKNFLGLFTLQEVQAKTTKSRRIWSEAQIGDDDDDDDGGAGAGAGGAGAGDAKRARTDAAEGAGGGGGLDTLMGSSVNVVGEMTPVADFNAMMSRRDVDLVDKAIDGIVSVARKLVDNSIMDQSYPKALDCLIALRQRCSKGKGDESERFNQILQQLRGQYAGHDFWKRVQDEKLTLIVNASTTPEMAENFFDAAPVMAAPVAVAAPIDDDEFDDAD